MFREGNRDCINTLLSPSRSVLENGTAIRAEPYERRMELWQVIKTNAGRYRTGECGTFLSDLNAHFTAQFDASLLLLAVTFRQNGEQSEHENYFSPRELDAYEQIEDFRYFRILSKKEIAQKIITRDEKTLALIRTYSISMKTRMDEIMIDPAVRDSIRSFVKKQWDENTRKVGDAIALAGLTPEWFATLFCPAGDPKKDPPVVIIHTGNDAAINLGQGIILKDAVVTRSSVDAAGSTGTTARDFAPSTSRTRNERGDLQKPAVSIHDSVILSSTVTTLLEHGERGGEESAPQSCRYVCLGCGTRTEPGAKFCHQCGGGTSVICSRCGSAHQSGIQFCPCCGLKMV